MEMSENGSNLYKSNPVVTVETVREDTSKGAIPKRKANGAKATENKKKKKKNEKANVDPAAFMDHYAPSEASGKVQMLNRWEVQT